MMVLGVLGDQRALRSQSPRMHNAVMARLGISGLYGVFPVRPEDLADAIRGIRALGIAGVNVTSPHKEKVMAHLDRLSPEASAIGAVNTVVRRGDLLEGHNTDSGGFQDALAGAGFSVEGKAALLFGAGGAARAVLAALRGEGAGPLWLTSRSPRAARGLAQQFDAEAVSLESVPGLALRAEFVINATSASTDAESPELAALAASLCLSRCGLVMDINYGRGEGFWERLAMASGARFMDGLPMLAHQAARSFALWWEIRVSGEEFARVLRGQS
jgi:shikimate dehydrogenase